MATVRFKTKAEAEAFAQGLTYTETLQGPVDVMAEDVMSLTPAAGLEIYQGWIVKFDDPWDEE